MSTLICTAWTMAGSCRRGSVSFHFSTSSASFLWMSLRKGEPGAGTQWRCVAPTWLNSPWVTLPVLHLPSRGNYFLHLPPWMCQRDETDTSLGKSFPKTRLDNGTQWPCLLSPACLMERRRFFKVATITSLLPIDQFFNVFLNWIFPSCLLI